MKGPGSNGNTFTVSATRNNPAPVGVVTGKQTYASFLSSVLGEVAMLRREGLSNLV